MLKWEYTNIGITSLEDPRINNLGKAGWELVTSLQVTTKPTPFAAHAIDVIVLIFKRELPDDVT